MIKIRRLFGLTVVTGTSHEIKRVTALSGISLRDNDALTVLPSRHHVHRNPRKKPLLKYIEDKQERLEESKVELPDVRGIFPSDAMAKDYTDG